MLILVILIKLFHLLIISFVLFTPFLTSNPLILLLHISFCFLLMIHWICNDDSCFLTFLEKKIRGLENNQQTFLSSIFNSIYIIKDYSFNKLIWLSTIFLTFYSIYNIKKEIDTIKSSNDH
jgi:hypothetical protein